VTAAPVRYNEPMRITPRVFGRAILLVVCVSAISCETLQLGRPAPRDPTRIPVEAVQAEVMAFTDSYTAVVSQAIDRIAVALPEQRAVLHDAKLRNVQNAIIIAAGQNPVGALLDMTVMVTLQRHVAEEYWLPDRFGDAGEPLVTALRMLEEEIWSLAERALTDEQFEALTLLVPQIRERFRGQVLVSSIRASDFADDRQAAVAQLRGGGSLLSLFQLDPLAGLSPAAQELAQSRLLAERAFFWAKRLPLILNWQMQDVILEALGEPESQQLVAAATRLTESSERLSAVAEELSQWMPEERSAAIAQIDEVVTAQRNAAIEQLVAATAAEREAALEGAFAGIAAEREAILRTFEQEDVRLRGLLEELRQTVEASTVLSTSLTTTVDSVDRLVAGFAPAPDAPPPDPDRRPFDILDYQTTAESLTATVTELNTLMTSITELMASPVWDERNTQVAAATDRAQTGLEDLIDRSFRRGLLLVGLLVVGGFSAAVGYRLIAARIG